MTGKKKTTVQFILSWVLVLIGVILIFFGFFAPPLGVIHASVLTAFGEILTFAGAIMGIDYTYKAKLLRIQNRGNEEEKDEEAEG